MCSHPGSWWSGNRNHRLSLCMSSPLSFLPAYAAVPSSPVRFADWHCRRWVRPHIWHVHLSGYSQSTAVRATHATWPLEMTSEPRKRRDSSVGTLDGMRWDAIFARCIRNWASLSSSLCVFSLTNILPILRHNACLWAKYCACAKKAPRRSTEILFWLMTDEGCALRSSSYRVDKFSFPYFSLLGETDRRQQDNTLMIQQVGLHSTAILGWWREWRREKRNWYRNRLAFKRRMRLRRSVTIIKCGHPGWCLACQARSSGRGPKVQPAHSVKRKNKGSRRWAPTFQPVATKCKARIPIPSLHLTNGSSSLGRDFPTPTRWSLLIRTIYKTPR